MPRCQIPSMSWVSNALSRIYYFGSFLNLAAINVQNIPKNVFLCSFFFSSIVLLVTVSMLAFTAVWSNWPPPLHKRKKTDVFKSPKASCHGFHQHISSGVTAFGLKGLATFEAHFTGACWKLLIWLLSTLCNFILWCNCGVIPTLWSLYLLMWMGSFIQTNAKCGTNCWWR